MALKNPSIGEFYSPAYQMSGVPFVTSSIVNLGAIREITFDTVSKFLVVRNTGATSTAIAVAFTQNGLKTSNSNYFILSGSESFSAELKTDRLFISGAVGASVPFSVVAGLTVIPWTEMLPVTGSNGFGGVG